jgi:hypothetical protein
MTSSYPYTPTTLRTSVKPRSWVPFKPREGLVEVPPLPFKPDLLPISYLQPRVSPNVLIPEPPPRSSKKRTKRIIRNVALELMEQQAQLGEDGYSGITDERYLWNCVNRYVEKDRKTGVKTKGITLFLVHGAGFPKEVIAMPVHAYQESNRVLDM